MRWAIAVLTALAALVAALNEVASLDRFAAERLNFPAGLAWTLPGMVTIATLAGALMWTCLRPAPLRAAGKRLNVSCAVISALAVGLDHAAGAAGWWQVPAGLVGALVPALATWLTHLLARMTADTAADVHEIAPAVKAAGSGVVVSTATAATYVYRLLDHQGLLLYVGVTADLTGRIGAHRRAKSWWPEVAEVLTERYPNRAAALAVEQSAIANEKPIHNTAPGGLRDHAGGAEEPVRVARSAIAVAPSPPPTVEGEAPTALAPPPGSIEAIMQAEGVSRRTAYRRMQKIRGVAA